MASAFYDVNGAFLIEYLGKARKITVALLEELKQVVQSKRTHLTEKLFFSPTMHSLTSLQLFLLISTYRALSCFHMQHIRQI